ncbi:MAG: aldo/keto reductase [Clostridiales bacterium]|nr:aldo/keto reductase [Clostridiales bacterium]
MTIGKKMPKIALGAWAWGNDGTFGDNYTADQIKPVYDTAMANGLNLWDTAYVYGMGTSEKILGELMKETNPEDVIVSTKFTPQCEDGTPQAMQNMIDGSKKRLGVDIIDIYWIHNPMDVEKYTPMLIPLAKSGQIKSIGVSNHNLAELKKAEEILGQAGLKIDAVQNHFSILNRSSETSGLLQYCKEKGITFFAYMILEQGALSGKYSSKNPFPEGSDRANTYNPMMNSIDSIISAVNKIAQAHNISAAQVCTAWASAKGTLPIIGVTKKEQVEDAAKAAEVVLSEDEISRIEKAADEQKISTIRYWEKEMK